MRDGLFESRPVIPIGYLVRELRQARMLTLSELAKRSSISRGHLFHVENRTFAPSLATLEKICRGLRLDTNRLLTMSVSDLLLEDTFIRAVHPLIRCLNTAQRSQVLRTLEAAPKDQRRTVNKFLAAD